MPQKYSNYGLTKYRCLQNILKNTSNKSYNEISYAQYAPEYIVAYFYTFRRHSTCYWAISGILRQLYIVH